VFDVAILVDALRRLADGETVIDPTIVSRLVGRRRREDPLAELTQREREVLSLVAEGMSNRAIAARLFVTERTVAAHINRFSSSSACPSPATGIAGCSRCLHSSAPDRAGQGEILSAPRCQFTKLSTQRGYETGTSA